MDGQECGIRGHAPQMYSKQSFGERLGNFSLWGIFITDLILSINDTLCDASGRSPFPLSFLLSLNPSI